MFLLRVSILPLFWNCFDRVVYVYFGFHIDKNKEFEEGLIIIHQSKNDQQKKDKRTNNDLQNTIQKTKERVTRTPLKPWVNFGAPVW